jgi:predicted deacylase
LAGDSRHAPLEIGGFKIEPGERRLLDLPVADLYTHAQMTMPVHVIRGRRPGPIVFLTGAVHGDELNGVEIIRRLLALKTLRGLRGTLLAVPVVNVHGFIHHSRYLPDRRDLNRNFPGQARGSVTSRLASLVSREIIDRADYGIDLHTGAIHRSNLPQIRGDTDNPEVLRLAKAFGAPVILHARLRDGSMREYAAEQDIPVLVYEGGEALRLDEISIRAGLRGVRRVLAELGMLRRPAGSGGRAVDAVVSRHSTWVRAPISGMVRLRVYCGASVRKGQRLASISDPFGEVAEDLPSPCSGVVIGHSTLPLTHEGEALVHIARFEDHREASGVVEEFQLEHEQVGT